MTRLLLSIIFIILCSGMSFAQKSDIDDDDTFLTKNFELLNSVDTELAIAVSPIIEKRLKRELKDSNSFYRTYTNLSKHITIKMSEDSLVKTYSWDRINGGSWHDMASYVQYKTPSGKINHLRLDSGDEPGTGEPTSVIIYDVFHIKSKNESYYLLLGWGTYGGGKHHSLARVYQIKDNNFVLCNTIFQGEKYLFAGANRIDKINLNYNSKSKKISYFYYEFDDNIGFYKRKQQKQTWLFKNEKFIKQD